jgi:hypothetical protein
MSTTVADNPTQLVDWLNEPADPELVAEWADFRVEAGVSRAALSESLGWSTYRLERFERGQTSPRFATLGLYRHHLGATIIDRRNAAKMR